ncbi:MAG: HD domain-containing protein, partial [Pseudomonadota bacterium]
NVQVIADAEGGDLEVLAGATLLHDCVDVPKDSPDRQHASRLAAEKARGLLTNYGWVDSKVAEVVHAIEAHSFSARIEPISIEAKVLQDADRLDAIGYTGVARCFYVSGRLGRALYDPEDPEADGRELNDLDFAIDHFTTKLLQLSGSFQTRAGQALANARHCVVEDFLHGFLAEVMPESGSL